MADLGEEIVEIIEVTHIHIEEVKPSFKGLTGGWSKYGGKRISITSNQHGISTVHNEWVCQSCGGNQPHDLSPYLYEYPIGEYIRICATCLNQSCQPLKLRLGIE